MRRFIGITCLIVTALASFGETTFSGRFVVISSWDHEKTTGSSALKETFPDFWAWTHTSGTNSYQMDSIAVNSATLTSEQALTVSLSAIDNGFGDSISFKRVKFLAMECASNNYSSVKFGGFTDDAWGGWVGTTNDAVVVQPGGFVMFAAPQGSGYPVGATTTNILITNMSTSNATYYLYIGGVKN